MRSKKVRRAAFTAKLSGWTLAIFAFFSLLFALFGDIPSLVMGIALGAFAFNELRGGKMIARFDPNGARVLGFNQLVLGAVVVLYSGWSILSAQRSSDSSVSSVLSQFQGGTTGDPDTDSMLQSVNAAGSSVSKFATYALYGTLAFAGAAGCGLTALYYFTRARVVRDMVAETPAWVLDTMRAAA